MKIILHLNIFPNHYLYSSNFVKIILATITLIVIKISIANSKNPPVLNKSIIPTVQTMKITHGNI